jgi:Zn-dependent M28 family amino/carboxypeptidase
MTPNTLRRVWRALLAPLTLTAACDAGSIDQDVRLDTPELGAVLESMSPEAIERHVRVLAHDSLTGRAPGTSGYAGAAAYVEASLSALGLEPAGVDGTFRQPVSLRESLVVEAASGMSIDGRELVYDLDFYLSPDPLREAVSIVDAPVAFVGYGVSAPALGYDDYAEIDVEGKVVAYLSGAPPAFPSNERAYYSSGATKQAEAVARGAIGFLTFWDPDDPRLRWEVNAARAKRGSFAWLDSEGRPNRGDPSVRGVASLNHAATTALFDGAPRSLDEALTAAGASTPQAFDLGARVTTETRSRHRTVDSWNVVARLPGSDPVLGDEHVTYVAHVDHFGIGVPVEGDSVYNGAHDNASGTSIVLEIARAYADLPTAPRRSILFLFVTAEEWGLLGSDYFARNPTVPKTGVVATFSLDMPFLFHPLLDIVPYGAEHSSLGPSVEAAAHHLGLAIGPDPIPEQVLFIRSDHFSFIRQGIPALFIKSGFETGDPDLDGAAINSAFRQNLYHTPFDEIDQGFDWDAGAAHARINFLTGYVVAQETARPRWNVGDFFGELFGQAVQ